MGGGRREGEYGAHPMQMGRLRSALLCYGKKRIFYPPSSQSLVLFSHQDTQIDRWSQVVGVL